MTYFWLKKSEVHNFADDNTISGTCTSLQQLIDILEQESAFCSIIHCVKSVRTRSFFYPYFPTYFLRIQSECGKIRTIKTPNTDNFHIVMVQTK